jgi:uncharacterized protein (DUF58 family)
MARQAATPASRAPSAAPALTPEELRELRRLQVQAGRRVDALFAGDYRSAVRGRGMEFEEVRAYTPGDDVRRIDWNVTARTHEPFVKVFREERQVSVLLVVDVSGSTRVGSGGRDGATDKRRQLARIAGGLAWATSRNRDHVGLLTFTDRVETVLTPRAHRGHVWAVIRAVYAAEAAGRGTDIAEALSYAARIQRRRAVLVVASDFLDPGPWDRAMAALAARHTVHAICLHDPLDDGLAGLGLVEVEDAETGRRQLVDGATFLGRSSLTERVGRLRRTGARALGLRTDEDPYLALHRHFSAGKHR